MKLNIKQIYFNNTKNWKYFNHNIDNKLKLKISKLLIKNKGITIRNKIVSDPNLLVTQNTKLFRNKYNSNLSYSWYNIYLLHSNKYVHPWKNTKYQTIYSPRKTTTYQNNMYLKQNTISICNTLDYIVFSAGWAHSIDEARHIIKKGYISVNNKIIKSYKYCPRKGSIIINQNPNCIFRYYYQKYCATLLLNRNHSNSNKHKTWNSIANKKYKLKNNKVNYTYRKGRLHFYKQLKYIRYPFSVPLHNITKININKIVIL